MKYMFFIIVLTVTLAINGYVFYKGWLLLPPSNIAKILYATIFWLLALSFFFRMYKGDSFSPSLSLLLAEISFTWITAIIYFALFFLAIDLIRGVDYFVGFIPGVVKENPLLSARIAAFAVVVAVVSLLLYGNYKFNNPNVTSLTISIDKRLPQEGVKIVLMSDLHLSSYINGEHLKNYVELVNSQNPDLVLIAGDIVDRDLKPLIDWNVSEILKQIESKLGVYAVSGNHEFYGGDRERIYQYIRESGITMLLDSVVVLENSLQIVGREDMNNQNRKELWELMEGVDKDFPIILLDHQPYNLDQAARNGVDLQLSGHTHNGQFWPGNLIVKRMYEIAYGYGKKGDTHYYVTSGIGIWGPKFRIGTLSEIVVIHLKESS